MHVFSFWEYHQYNPYIIWLVYFELINFAESFISGMCRKGGDDENKLQIWKIAKRERNYNNKVKG